MKTAKTKARVFRALGYTRDDWRRLENDLRAQHLTKDAIEEPATKHGQFFRIVARLEGPTGGATIRSVWIIRFGEEFPRLVSAYPGQMMKRPRMLEVVALRRDLPEFHLKAGHIGTVVEVFEPDAVMVEFLDGEGDTVALLDLNDADVRTASKLELNRREYPEPLPPGVHPPIAAATKPVSR